MANYDDKTVGRDRNHVNYDGVNVYGDEVTTNIKGVAAGLLGGATLRLNMQQYPSNYNVSRTGYNETDLTDNKASNTKIDFFITSLCK
jgi:hypothetical protein